MNKRFTVLMVTLLLILPGAVYAQNRGPRKLLKDRIDSAVQQIKATDMNDTEELLQLKEKLERHIEPLFHFRELAQRSLGPPAQDLSKSQLDTFTKTYKKFLEQLYLGRLISIQAGSEQPFRLKSVEFGEQELRGNYAKIPSRITVNRGDKQQQFSVQYLMVKRGNKWGIYDLAIEDMRLVDTYRTQFTDFLQSNSIEALIDNLQERIKSGKLDGEIPALDDS